MRKLYAALTVSLTVCFLLLNQIVFSQTVLINPAGDGGFENGTDFASNGWTVANTTNLNRWFVGTVPGPAGAAFTTRAAYVSSNAAGTTWDYTTTSTSVSHFYRDVTVPAGETDVTLSFNWQGLGETGFWDALMVHIAPTSYVPAGATTSLGTATLPGPTVFVAGFWNVTTLQTATVKLPVTLIGSCSGPITFRLIFTWKNDGTGGSSPSTAIDNISLTSQIPRINGGGTFTINNTLPNTGTNFSSFTEAINALNSACISTSGVTFNVAAGQTFAEDVPPVIVSGTAANPIIFQKDGAGTNPVIRPTGTTGSNDFGFAISGGDFITVDGIDINIATGSAVEFGFLIRNLTNLDGANNNTIRNSTVTLNRTNTSSRGILQTAATTGGGFVPTTASGANNNNRYLNINIRNVYGGIYLLGNASFPDLGSEVGTTACNIMNQVGDPTVPNDIGNGSSQAFGVRVANQSGAKVYNNMVSNVTATTTVDGIFVETFLGNTEVYNNRIAGIRNASTSSTLTASGMRITHTTTGTHNIRVYNNTITDITHGFTGAATASRYIRGLFVSGTGGATTQTYDIDFNSVRIDGSASPNTSSAAYEIATTSGPIFRVRNNIFSNYTGPQGATARHHVVVSTSATLLGNTGSVFSYNNLWISSDLGTSGFLVRMNTTDYTTISAFQSAVTTATNNLATDPQFSSPTDLHTNNPALNGAADPAWATNSPWVTNDMDCETRPTSTDIGSDEFTITPKVLGTIVYNQASTANVFASSMNNPILRIDVPVTGNSGALNLNSIVVSSLNTSDADIAASGVKLYRTSSPVFSTANPLGTAQSFSGGTATFSGLNYDLPGNSTTYIWVTYDIVANPVSGNTVDAQILANGIDIGGNTFPATDQSPAGSRTIVGPLSGTYTIGPSQTAPNYTTLTAAIADLNLRGLSAAVNFELAADYSSATETFPISIEPFAGASNTNRLTVRPASGVTASIIGSSTSSIIRLNGADFVTIDGSNNATSTRNLTIENTSTGTNTAAIWVASLGTAAGATDNIIRNTIIKAGSNTVSSTFGIYAAGTTISTTGTGNDNDRLTIHNNSISKAYYGIYAQATSTGVNDDLTVTSNSIGSNTPADYITFRGTLISQATGAVVRSNTVFNMISTNTDMRAMAFGNGFVNSVISRNMIYEINYNATSFSGGKGITLNTATATSNVTIDNNVIYGLKGHGSTTATNNTWAIMLEGTTGGVNIVFNSINISDNRTATTSTDLQGGLHIAAGVTAITLRNNVIAVTATPGNAAGKMYTIYSLAATPFAVSDYNNLFVSGTQNHVGFISSTDRTVLNAWQSASGQDANSISQDPLFNSNSNLIPQPGSPLLGAGVAVSITVDYNAVTRNSPPTIGAYELALDAAAPVIVHTAPGGLCTIADRTITATISDGGGVATGANAPRLYYRKNSGAYQSVAGTLTSGTVNNGTWSFDIVNSTMGGLAFGDVVSYFFVAQDATGNVAGTPAGVVATDVNTVTTNATAPFRYIAGGTLTGTYTVGLAGQIATLTHASELYNAGCPINGDVTFSLIDNNYSTNEIFPIVFRSNPNASSVNTLTIKPAAGISPVVSGNVSPMLKFSGADFITVDGSNTMGGTTRDLTLQNTSTQNGSVVVWVGSLGAGAGATDISIRNSNIVGGTVGSTSPAVTTFGIFAGSDDGSSANGPDNDNLTIVNNSISNVSYGIQAVGSAANPVDNMVITGNSVGAANAATSIGNTGILVGQTTGSTIANNTIFNVQGNGAAVGAQNVFGLVLFTGTTNTLVDRNNIYSVKYTGTAGYGGKGIDVNTGSANANLTIQNNMLSDISGDGWTGATSNDLITGIRITGTNGNVSLFHNTVHMSGNISRSSATTDISMALFVGSATTNLTVQNNIFSNSIVNTTGTAKAYSIFSAAANTAFTIIDNNNYVIGGSQGVLGFIGSDRTSLADLVTFFGGNTSSTNVAPVFVSATDAHLVPNANCALDGTGIPVGVTVDIDNQARSMSNPDVGADEFTSTYNLTVVDQAACAPDMVNLTAAAATAGSSPNGPFTYWTDNTATTAVANPSSVGDGTYFVRLVSGSCSDIKAVTVTINPVSVGGSLSAAQTICSGTAPADITLSGNTGAVVRWERSSDAAFTTPTTITNTTTTLTGTDIGNLTANTWFRAVVKSGVCNEANSAAVMITVDPVSVGGSVSTAQTICSGTAPADITLSGNTGDVVRWERSSDAAFTTPTTIANTTATLTGAAIGNLTANTWFRAVVKSGACNEANSAAVMITVDPVTVGGTVSAAQTICSGTAPADLTLSGNTGDVVRWERSSDAAFTTPTTIANTTTTLTGATIGNLTATTWFRAVVKSGACAEANSTSVMITVDGASDAGTLSSNSSVCPGGTPPNITASGITGTVVRWERSTDFAFTSPVTINNTTTTLAPGPLTQTTYFRIVVKSGTCAEAVSANPAIVNVITAILPATQLAGTAGGAQACASWDVAHSNNYFNNCNIIATVTPSGASAVSGTVSACVKIESAVPVAPVTNEPYVARHFNIAPVTNPTTATYTATLYFSQAEFDQFNAARGLYPALPANATDNAGIANLRVSMFPGSATVPGGSGGIQIDPADADISFANGRWSVSFNATGTGSFYVHTGSFVLPVTLLNLNGEQAGSINKLFWSTSTETNNKGFELERSVDGNRFSSIGFVASKGENGNSTATLQYAFDDLRPAAGTNYYRLKQVDRDGRISYSKTILITRKANDVLISNAYPNPATRELNLVITSPRAERVTIVVTDLTGKVLIQRAMQLMVGDNIEQLNVQSFAAGTYVIKAICANGCEAAVHKFVKR